MTANRPDSAQELQYPPIRVNRSLAQLDLNTLIMRSNPHRPAQEASSLEDSTYGVLALGDLSDDDGHTASVTSTSPDDISVKTLSEDEDDDDDFENHYVDEAPQAVDTAAADPLDAQVIAAGEDSTLTERPSLADSENGYYFKMDEQPTEAFDGVDGYSVVKEFTPEQSSSNVLKPYGCSDIRLTVRAGLADRFYPDRGSFRILFVGRMDDWSEEGIKSSVLKALVASPGSSKSVMVRGQVEAYSPVLHTDHCTDIEVLSETGKETRVILTLHASEKTVLDLASRRKGKDSAGLPDLAIFCYAQPSTISLSESDLVQVRRAFQKHDIPCLDITDHRRFNEEQLGFHWDPQSLRVCVEGRTEHDYEFAEVDTLPVDVYNFIHLEPSDLNRHLAAISPHLHTPPQSSYGQTAKLWRPNGLVPSFIGQGFKSLGINDTPLKLFVAILALSGMVALSYLNAWVPQALKLPPTPGTGSCTLAAPSIYSTVSSVVTSTQAASFATSATPSAAVKDILQDIIPKLPQVVLESDQAKAAKELKKKKKEHLDQTKGAEKLRKQFEKKKKCEMRRQAEEKAAKIAKIGGFEIHPSGDQQFILRPSKDFIGRTRKPQLQIQVSRDAKTVPIRYERTMDGVYIVDLAQEYPIGSFNVSIATHSKPLMQQSFNINLGHNKTRVAQWISLFNRDRITAQHNLRDLSSSIMQQAQTVYTRVAERDWIVKSDRRLADRLQEAKADVDRQLVAVSKAVREARDQTWIGLRKATAPVRTSRRTLWARNNAYIWRCGFERVVGLSSKDKNGKKTRSCEASNW
ncbi:hypothetical protein N0V90_001147 [Kalmusia sp. IMI 367209]|nr:hypothetical protein N0V90_001147 [Kalmusia sp. IMI 367209]